MSDGVSNTYHFVTVWSVEATPDEVFDVLSDAEALPRWWPAVYRRVRTVPLGDGTKKRVLDTQGWLPYRLHWEARVAEHDPPRLLGIRASGDFEGSGLWTLTPDGPRTTVRYEWRIRAEKPLLRTFSVVLKPVFAWNHRWAMARGLESLEVELARRRGKDVGPPPGPVSALRSSLILVLVVALLIALGSLTARIMSGLAST